MSTSRARSGGDGTIAKQADGRYKAVLRWKAVTGQEVSKTRLCPSIRAANLAMAEFKRLRDSGGDAQIERKTVGDLLDRWLDFKGTEVSAGTLDQYQYAAKHIKGETDAEYAQRIKANVSASKKEPKRYKEGLSNILLAKLHPQEIDKFLRSKTEEGLSPRYVKLLRTILSMALDQAVRWRLLDSNPTQYSTSIKQPPRTTKALSEQQAGALLAAAKDDRLCALWTLMLSLGLRRGEAIALRWSDCDRKAKTLSISRNRKKEGSKVVVGSLKTEASRRTLPLPGFLWGVLDEHRVAQLQEKEYLLSLGLAWAEPDALFATVTGHYLDPDNASKLFKTLMRRAGLEGWHLHELRHSAATILLSEGVPLEQVSKLLGHASIRITSDVYGHLSTEHLRGATDTMGAYLEGLKNGVKNPSVSRSVSQSRSVRPRS